MQNPGHAAAVVVRRAGASAAIQTCDQALFFFCGWEGPEGNPVELRVHGSNAAKGPFCGGFREGEEVWYMNNEWFVWRHGFLLDMVFFVGQTHPLITVRDQPGNTSSSTCLDGKPVSPENHVHGTYDHRLHLETIGATLTQVPLPTLLHHSGVERNQHNAAENDVLRLPNSNELVMTLCLR